MSPGAQFRGVDYAALWRQVDAESARVVVVDIERCAVVAGRSMGDSGDTTSRMPPDSTLERLFPGAVARVERWCDEGGREPGELFAHGLSPRQWVYFWTLGPKAGVLAVVHHRYGRGAVAAGDTATIRLLCEHWLAPELQAMGIGRAAQTTWNRVDRRARAAAPRELWAALAALGLAGACGLWLATGGGSAPAAPADSATTAELQRLARLSDETLMRSLAHAMSERDYGEAQEALADHLALGHFSSALVLNERKQVVAHAGLAKPPAVGQPLAASAAAALPASTQRLGLRWAGAPIGELLTVPPAAALAAGAQAQAAPAQAPGGTPAGSRIAGIVLALAGLLSGAWLWRHLHARYR